MPRAKKVTTEKTTEINIPPINIGEEADKPVKKAAATRKINALRRVPLDTYVPVVSNCVSPLIYVSKRQMGYKVEWENFGDIDYMQVQELIAMRGTDRKFFINNWIVINDDEYTAEEVYNTIGVSKQYENVVTPETIKQLLCKGIPQIRAEMGKMSDGLRRTVYEYTLKLKEDGEFDSIKKFDVIKELAGISDIE